MRKNTYLIIVTLGLLIASVILYSTKEYDSTKKQTNTTVGSDINELTKEKTIIDYLKRRHQLPSYYITKNEARKRGWNAAAGNLCEALPGRAIGGDIFTNRENKLPEQNGRNWFEADINYHCGMRNADRIVFSNDGLIFTTHDHYKTFRQQ